MGDKPTAVVATLARMTTSRLADKKSSGLLVRAACEKSTGSANLPTISIAATVAIPKNATDRNGPSPPPTPTAPRTKIIGTSARSSNKSMAKARRPTALDVPAIGMTSAVDDSASAKPKPSAAPLLRPSSISAPAMSNADTNNSAAPKPITRWRMPHNLRNDSSRPMENNSRMMPSSANGPIASASVIDT